MSYEEFYSAREVSRRKERNLCNYYIHQNIEGLGVITRVLVRWGLDFVKINDVWYRVQLLNYSLHCGNFRETSLIDVDFNSRYLPEVI